MPRKLDAERIEKNRFNEEKVDSREIEKKRIRDTIKLNRAGERKGTMIAPTKKMYAYQEMQNKIRVCAYCRVSTAEEAQVGSFEFQMQHFQKIIDENPRYEMVKLYSDEGISGTLVKKRVGFQEMMDDAKAGKIDLILTKSISRFGRNVAELLSAILELNNLNPPVAVMFEQEGLNTSDPSAKVIIAILSALAEMESQQKSEAIKAGIRYRMQEGYYKFSVKYTIGYYRDYSGMIKVEKNEAEIVKYIYDCCEEGYSPKHIAELLGEQNIRSPKGKDHWTSNTILNILRNEKYCGDVLYQKTYTMDYLTHKSVKNRDVLPQWHWENNHPAIIKREQWNRVQEICETHAWNKHSKQGDKKHLEKKFKVQVIKSGVLAGYFLIDMSWNKKERERFIEIINNIDELGMSPRRKDN
jgi:DNA invertase Pin-like site-specific DNA recombinase